MDEDNDGRFPDDSVVEVRYPQGKQEEQGDRVGTAVAAWLDPKPVRVGRVACERRGVRASAVTANVGRVGHAALGLGRPQRCWRSLRMRARSRRWAARTAGWRALALRQLR